MAAGYTLKHGPVRAFKPDPRAYEMGVKSFNVRGSCLAAAGSAIVPSLRRGRGGEPKGPRLTGRVAQIVNIIVPEWESAVNTQPSIRRSTN